MVAMLCIYRCVAPNGTVWLSLEWWLTHHCTVESARSLIKMSWIAE